MTRARLKTAAAFVVWTALCLQGPVPENAARGETPAAAATTAIPSADSPGRELPPEAAPALGGAAAPAAPPPATSPPPDATPFFPPADAEANWWHGPLLERFFWQPDLPRADLDFRAGYWARWLDGSPTLAAQYQGIDSSPFFNADGLFSDGARTLDLFATVMDNDTDAARLNYFGPNLTSRVRFDRYIHRQENDPLANFDITQSFFKGQNFNAGEDFATRIEQANADFRGKLSENLRWRINVRTLRKHGERQVRNLHRHVSCTECHVNGARQAIDWTTVALEPALEGKYGPVRFRASHQSQSLNQNDQLITDIDGGTPLFSAPLPYGYVPENYSQVNRLRVDADLMEDLRFNADLFQGDAHNLSRDIRRRFNGMDFQLVSHALDDRLSVTAYGKRINEDSDNTQQYVVPEEAALIQPLINYGRTATGLLARWRLLRRGESLVGLSVNGGYEYREIDRENAVYRAGLGFVDQRQTTGHLFHIGTNVDWSRDLDSYVRYKLESTQGPLYGVTAVNATVDTSLPEHINLIEIGGNWTPRENLWVNFAVDFQPSQSDTTVANFNETSLPMALTISYAPRPRWTLSGGYMWDPIWITQGITIGDDAPPETTNWEYRGVSQRIHLGSRYALTDSLSLTARAQYIRGQNTTLAPPPWELLPYYSNVEIDNVEVSAGADWWLRERVLLYFRYSLSEYATQPTQTYDGTLQAILLGFNAFY